MDEKEPEKKKLSKLIRVHLQLFFINLEANTSTSQRNGTKKASGVTGCASLPSKLGLISGVLQHGCFFSPYCNSLNHGLVPVTIQFSLNLRKADHLNNLYRQCTYNCQCEINVDVSVRVLWWSLVRCLWGTLAKQGSTN